MIFSREFKVENFSMIELKLLPAAFEEDDLTLVLLRPCFQSSVFSGFFRGFFSNDLKKTGVWGFEGRFSGIG
jgi:hypothetical protein